MSDRSYEFEYTLEGSVGVIDSLDWKVVVKPEKLLIMASWAHCEDREERTVNLHLFDSVYVMVTPIAGRKPCVELRGAVPPNTLFKVEHKDLYDDEQLYAPLWVTYLIVVVPIDRVDKAIVDAFIEKSVAKDDAVRRLNVKKVPLYSDAMDHTPFVHIVDTDSQARVKVHFPHAVETMSRLRPQLIQLFDEFLDEERNAHALGQSVNLCPGRERVLNMPPRAIKYCGSGFVSLKTDEHLLNIHLGNKVIEIKVRAPGPETFKHLLSVLYGDKFVKATTTTTFRDEKTLELTLEDAVRLMHLARHLGVSQIVFDIEEEIKRCCDIVDLQTMAPEVFELERKTLCNIVAGKRRPVNFVLPLWCSLLREF